MIKPKSIKRSKAEELLHQKYNATAKKMATMGVDKKKSRSVTKKSKLQQLSTILTEGTSGKSNNRNMLEGNFGQETNIDMNLYHS